MEIPPYRIDMSAQTAGEAKELLNLCSQIGLGWEAKKVMKTIIEKLETNPQTFGKLETELGSFVVRIGAVHPLSVRFAVHEEKQVVVVLELHLLS